MKLSGSSGWVKTRYGVLSETREIGSECVTARKEEKVHHVSPFLLTAELCGSARSSLCFRAATKVHWVDDFINSNLFPSLSATRLSAGHLEKGLAHPDLPHHRFLLQFALAGRVWGPLNGWPLSQCNKVLFEPHYTVTKFVNNAKSHARCLEWGVITPGLLGRRKAIVSCGTGNQGKDTRCRGNMRGGSCTW
jgi:hypothetical protein